MKTTDLLRSVIDPELGENIVDLGLVYSAEIIDSTVYIVMTLTSPACPFRDIIEEAIEQVIEKEGYDLNLTITFDPPWDQSKISPEVLLKRGLL